MLMDAQAICRKQSYKLNDIEASGRVKSYMLVSMQAISRVQSYMLMQSYRLICSVAISREHSHALLQMHSISIVNRCVCICPACSLNFRFPMIIPVPRIASLAQARPNRLRT